MLWSWWQTLPIQYGDLSQEWHIKLQFTLRERLSGGWGGCSLCKLGSWVNDSVLSFVDRSLEPRVTSGEEAKCLQSWHSGNRQNNAPHPPIHILYTTRLTASPQCIRAQGLTFGSWLDHKGFSIYEAIILMALFEVVETLGLKILLEEVGNCRHS